MIAAIEGELVGLKGATALVRVGAITYEVMVPAFDLQRLGGQVGRAVRFATLHYMESQGQGSSMLPRLIGFASSEDREFFELFTTVKGIGNRKALRALALPTGLIASAIAGRDVGMLISLPEIGRRTAETIIAELNGKVDRFARARVGRDGREARGDGGKGEAGELEGRGEIASSGMSARHALLMDAVAVLVQLGEQRQQAIQWVDRVLADDPDIAEVNSVVSAAFRVRGG